MKVAAVGVPWYREADYQILRDLFDDGHTFPAEYDKWLDKANGVLEHLKSRGSIVEQAYIKPEEFIAWCSARKLRFDSNARVEFANEFVRRKYRECS